MKFESMREVVQWLRDRRCDALLELSELDQALREFQAVLLASTDLVRKLGATSRPQRADHSTAVERLEQLGVAMDMICRAIRGWNIPTENGNPN